MTKRIAIVNGDLEGGFHIDATTFQVIQDGTDSLPEWAQGVVVGLMGERNGWYEKRMGQLPEAVMKPDTIQFGDLEWLALDHNGDEVHIEANEEVRHQVLAGYLGLDISDAESFAASPVFANALARAEIDAGRFTQPTDEATLAEAEGQSFGEAKVVNG
jgi:hypothetical protein